MGAVLTVCSCLLRYIYLYVGIVEVAPPICEEKRGLISTLLTRTDAFNLLPFFFFGFSPFNGVLCMTGTDTSKKASLTSWVLWGRNLS